MADLTADAENPDLRNLASSPLTAAERDELRAEHHINQHPFFANACHECGDPWPCRVVRLLDMVDRQEAVIAERDAELADVWESHRQLYGQMVERLAVYGDGGITAREYVQAMRKAWMGATYFRHHYGRFMSRTEKAMARDALADAPEDGAHG